MKIKSLNNIYMISVCILPSDYVLANRNYVSGVILAVDFLLDIFKDMEWSTLTKIQ